MSRNARPSPPPPPPLLLKSRKSLTFLFLFVLFLAQQATLDYDDDDGQTQKSRIPLIQGTMKMMMLPMIDDPTKRGLLFATLSYLVYSFLQGPDTHMSRPHPGVWRVAHGSFVLYLLFLVFLVFQETKESARANVFEYLAPNLKVSSSSSSSLGEEGTTNNGGGGLYEERTYATDCRIFTPESSASSRMQNVKNTILDEFFLAHVLGWFGKALAIRDWRLLWAYSILFELMEVTFRHWLKNFNECWWDSWVLDVLICNFGGMWVGMRATKYFATSNDRGSHSGSSREESSEEDNRFMNGGIAAENREENSSEEEEEYDIDDTEEHEKSKKSSSALSKRTKENESGGQNDRHHRRRPSSNFVRVARKSIENYILPEKGHNWYRYEWQPFKTPGRFIQCVFLIGMCLSFELNAFFLKFIYAIPPPHILNTLRLTLWFAQANIAIREYYVFITDESGIWKAQLGANAWLAIAAMAMEFLVILKHGDGLFTAKWPKAVVRCWLAVGVAMVGGLTVWQFRMRSSSDEKKERKRKTKMI